MPSTKPITLSTCDICKTVLFICSVYMGRWVNIRFEVKNINYSRIQFSNELINHLNDNVINQMRIICSYKRCSKTHASYLFLFWEHDSYYKTILTTLSPPFAVLFTCSVGGALNMLFPPTHPAGGDYKALNCIWWWDSSFAIAPTFIVSGSDSIC